MKSYHLVIHDEAKVEITDAYYWYELQQPDLGEKLLEVLDDCFESITSNPKKFPKKLKNMRLAVIKDFPYVVVFEIKQNEIIIYAFFHTSRNPIKWKQRS